jgi:hypothetical protein
VLQAVICHDLGQLPRPPGLHPYWYISGIIYPVASLHTRYHAACGVILTCLNFILSKLPGSLLGNIRVPITLKTVFTRLGIEDKFVVYPVWYNCHKVFQPGIEDLLP